MTDEDKARIEDARRALHEAIERGEPKASAAWIERCTDELGVAQTVQQTPPTKESFAASILRRLAGV